MPSRAKASPSTQLQALEEGLSTFWMATFFPMAGTTTAGVRRVAKQSGRRALQIRAAAEAAGDEKTAKAAVDLAKRLVPYLDAKVITWAFEERAATRAGDRN